MGTLVHSLAGLVAQLATLTATRLELFSLEALEARDRLLCRLGFLLLALAFLLLALLVASLAVAVAFWPTGYRVLALGVLALVYALIGVGLLLWLRHRLKQDPEPFVATLDVLRADAQSLRGVAVPAEHNPSGDFDAGASAATHGPSGDGS